jgi:hypothetical protein
MSTNNQNWANHLNNGLIEPSRRPAAISAGMINKPMHREQYQDMKHDRFEVITDNSRQNRLKFNDKRRYASHRSVSFLPQE